MFSALAATSIGFQLWFWLIVAISITFPSLYFFLAMSENLQLRDRMLNLRVIQMDRWERKAFFKKRKLG